MSEYLDELMAFYSRATPKIYAADDISIVCVEALLCGLSASKSFATHLDVGCGTAWLPVLLQNTHPETYSHGVDISLDSLLVGKKIIQSRGLSEKIKLYHRDVEELEILPGLCDLVTACSSLMLLRDPKEFVIKAGILLRPGGVFAFSTQTKDSFLNPYKLEAARRVFGLELPDVKDHLNTPQECRRVCSRSGFEDVLVTEKNYDYPVRVENQKWFGSWLHPQNPLRNISEDQGRDLDAEFKRLLTHDAVDGKIICQRRFLYVWANKA